MNDVNNTNNTNSTTDKEQKKYFFESRGFRKLLYGILALVVILLSFRTGMLVGYQKAFFSMRAGQNYQNVFFDPKDQDSMAGFARDNFFESHGTIGQIIQVSPPSLIIRGPDQIEKSVQTATDTAIMRFQESVPLSSLQPGDAVIVIGSPNSSGQIEAKLIRYLPPNLPPPL